MFLATLLESFFDCVSLCFDMLDKYVVLMDVPGDGGVDPLIPD